MHVWTGAHGLRLAGESLPQLDSTFMSLRAYKARA